MNYKFTPENMVGKIVGFFKKKKEPTIEEISKELYPKKKSNSSGGHSPSYYKMPLCVRRLRETHK